MVIDTAAVLAWLKWEPVHERIVAALARPLRKPLLFVGNDFAQKDIQRC